jgi:hypothetical protein
MGGNVLENLFEILSLVLVTILFSFLLIQNISVKFKLKNIKAKILQEQIDKVVLYDKLEELMGQNDISGQSNDGFLKFVSQSRDWAFGYIEEAQKAIEEFQLVATPILYNNSEESGIKDLIVAYEKLLEMLPENSGEES